MTEEEIKKVREMEIAELGYDPRYANFEMIHPETGLSAQIEDLHEYLSPMLVYFENVDEPEHQHIELTWKGALELRDWLDARLREQACVDPAIAKALGLGGDVELVIVLDGSERGDATVWHASGDDWLDYSKWEVVDEIEHDEIEAVIRENPLANITIMEPVHRVEG